MTKNWALVIGINQYKFLQPLQYAKQDAQSVHDFFSNALGFEKVFLFSDDLATSTETSLLPNRANLLRCLQQFMETSRLKPEDNFWFFFSGYGMVDANQDYLIPIDGNPENIENTGISLKYLIECLHRCGANNLILMLDACHHQTKVIADNFGQQTQQIARQRGVIVIFACSLDQCSYDLERLQTGVFTYALIEGLGHQGQCATIERLNQYLTFRVSQLVSQYKKAQQTPYIVVEPKVKSHLILLPKNATLDDISTLKIIALQAEADKNLKLAEELWMQIKTATSSLDIDAIAAIQRITQLRSGYFCCQIKITLQLSSVERNSVLSLALPTREVTSTKEKSLQLNNTSAFNQDFRNVKTNNIYSYQNSYTTSLCSVPKVDYQQLQSLLATGNWKAADRETLNLLLKAAGREKQGWLNIQSINEFPATDLGKLDRLWVEYSDGRFGLSVQKRIWENLGEQLDSDYEKWCKFCDRVGWYVNNNWLFYSDIIFSLSAPQGHFPAAGLIYTLTAWRGWVTGSYSCLVGFSSLVYKMRACGL